MLHRLTAAFLLASPLAAAAVEPGNWEFSLVAMPTGHPQPAAVTQTRCLTERDARDPSRVLGGQGSGTCEFTNRNPSATQGNFGLRTFVKARRLGPC